MIKIVCLISLISLLGCSSLKQQSLQLDISRNWSRQTTRSDYVGPLLINTTAPLIQDEVVYQGNAHDGIVALSRKSGNLIWRKDIKNGVTSGLAIDKDKIFFAGNDGQFYALKKTNGEVLWSYPTQSETFSKPIFDSGRVIFLSANGNLTAVEAESGKIVWSYFQRDNANMNIRSSSSATIDGNLLYVGFGDGTISCLDKNTGFLKWDRNLSTPKEKFRDLDSKPVVDNDILYISTYEGGLYALKKISGDVIWKTERGSSSTPLLFGNKIYYSSTDGLIVSLDKSTGKELWTYKVKHGVGSMITYFKEMLLFGTSAGPLEIISLEGEYITDYSTGWGISAPIAINETQSEIYVFSNYGNIYSLSLNWKRPIQDWPWEKL